MHLARKIDFFKTGKTHLAHKNFGVKTSEDVLGVGEDSSDSGNA